MKKTFMLLAILLLSSKAYSLENVIGFGVGYSNTRVDLDHWTSSTYKNPNYETELAEWEALSEADQKKEPKPSEFFQNTLNQIKANYGSGINFTVEYQARLTNRIVLAVNLENTTSKINKYNGVNLSTNSTEINFLSLFPFYQNEKIALRLGAGLGAGFASIQNNSEGLIGVDSKKFYAVLNVLADAEYNISNNVMLFTRLTLKPGRNMFNNKTYNTNLISKNQENFNANNDVVSIDKNTIKFSQLLTTNISVGIRYKL